MDDAHGRLLRDLPGSGRPLSDAVMPEHWPVLTGAHCVLRVLDEDDVQHWRTDEGNRLFEQQHYLGGQPPPTDVAAMEIRLARVANRAHRPCWPGWCSASTTVPSLVQEALTLATQWAMTSLEPDTVIVLLPEDETVDLDPLIAAGFRPDGPPEPWEVGRTRYRFAAPGP